MDSHLAVRLVGAEGGTLDQRLIGRVEPPPVADPAVPQIPVVHLDGGSAIEAVS
jgi:hypothetical protein